MRKRTCLGLKGIVGLATCLAAVGACGQQASASSLLSENVIQEEAEAQDIAVEELCGYVDVPYTIHSIEESAQDIQVLGDVEIPAAYDAREEGKVTSVKRQNPWGNCWSFAAMSALESSLISDGYSQDMDLSEYHLNYYCYKAVTDPLNGTAGDGFTYSGTFEEFLDAGGNILVAYHALTNWVGAVEEEVTGYPNTEAAELEDTVESAYLNDVVHLQQMYQLKKSDQAAIKKEIMEHGSLTASFYYTASYYNSSTGGYYNSVNTNSNHAVAVVGWDDNFSKTNFKTQPSADGAWLVKNSWGSSFGQDGYLWISYEDTSLGDAMCLLLAESADNYDNNYQYDGSYMSMQLKGKEALTLANVYQVQEGETQEALQAVSFELGNTIVDYSIQIYGSLRDKSNPLSGIPLLEEPVEGTTLYQGYYTVELPEQVLLNPGETFAVVIDYAKAGDIYFLMERSTVWNNIEYVASAEENQSFFSMDGGITWTDAGKKYNGNIRIKAFTDNTDLSPRQLVEEVTVTPEQLELAVGESGLLQAAVAPEDAENTEVIWSSLDETVASVDQNGLVTAHKGGSTNIICASADGGASTSIQVIVRNVVELKPSEAELTVGESMTLALLVNGVEIPIALGEDFAFVNAEIASDIVTLASDGTITGNAQGSCTITFINKEEPEETASAVITIRTPFEDIRTTDWQYPFVVNAYEQGIMIGKAPELFGTNDMLTRSQFVTVLYNYAGKPELTSYEDCFEDVDAQEWYAEPIAWAVQQEITAGYGNTFGVSDIITREQFVKMLYAYAISAGMVEEAPEGDLSSYVDGSRVSSWAKEAMLWATQNDLLAGKPTSEGELIVDPQGGTTRAECAAIMTKFHENLQ